jgi:CO dehydrogenase/acetyl-CoA synthase epsilon subunit
VLEKVKKHSEEKCTITPEVLKKMIRKAKEDTPS